MEKAPELLLGLDLYIQGWNDLSRDRPSGFGPGRIPWTAMDAYCRHLGLRGDDREDFLYHIKGLDDVYLDWYGKKHGPKNKPGKKKGDQAPKQRRRTGHKAGGLRLKRS